MSALDTKLVVDGDTYWVHRDFELMKRLEQAFGPLAEIDAKLRAYSYTGAELVTLYNVVLAAQRARPEERVIEVHVLDGGVREASQQIALLVMQLFHGHRRALQWLKEEAARDAANDEEDDADPRVAV